MKRSTFTSLVLFAGIGLYLFSCTPESNGTNCLALVLPDTLRFNILDKDAREDLFFSDTPVYDTTEVLLLKKLVNNELVPVVKVIGESSGETYFYTFVIPNDTLFLKIADQALDTISFTGKSDNKPCPQAILDQVKFNSEAPENNAHGRAVPLYRK